ncbi:MAG: Hsp20/alpha crystallin family protein [Candidatus Neomarinimicrobiota bacterium]
MTLVKWNPNTALRSWNSFDRMFRDFFQDDYEEEAGTLRWAPSTDINENENGYTVIADLPGLDKKDVHINVKDNVLTISGERKYEKDEKSSFHRRERLHGTFQRCFRLPAMIDEDKINAKFKNGILTIDLPKAEEVKPREIEIKVA